jgi:hypothetical protein
MEDIARYLDEFVDPTIKDFQGNPTSIRHAFLACVVTFHAIDYLTPPGRRPRNLRQKFNRGGRHGSLLNWLVSARGWGSNGCA